MMVVVEIFSNMAHFVPCKKSNDATRVASLFFQEIVRLHELPRSITFDRDTRFLGNLWRTLLKNIGSQMLYISNYNLQIDGYIKVVNWSLGNLLRSLSGEIPG